MKRILKNVIMAAVLFCLPAAFLYAEQENSAQRWSEEKAWQWSKEQGWLCGFNYVPANAISYTEMWMGYAFDPNLIDSELAAGEKTGFNCLRVVLPFVVWQGEPQAFKQRLDTFLGICSRHGIKAMIIFFDDCVFGPIEDPVFGKQPDVVPGWYANGWTPSPGHSIVKNSSQRPTLEKYVKDILTAFKNDQRILCWDLYNEPTNGGMGEVSVPLVEDVFKWARQVNPCQPLTIGRWNNYEKLNEVIFANSDIISFHNYRPAKELKAEIEELKKHNRPIICTEWLNRGLGSVVSECLPVFFKENAGCMHWGLVNGKTQTHLPWGHRPGDPEPKVWQHDLYHSDLRPYDPNELKMFHKYIEAGKSRTDKAAKEQCNEKPV